MQVALDEKYKTNLDDLKEKIRSRVAGQMPDVRLSFEPIELTDKVLSQGSPTPVEVRFSGRIKKNNEIYAAKLMEKLRQIPYLRDIQLGQSNKYPAINIEVDRVRAAQLGISMDNISRSHCGVDLLFALYGKRTSGSTRQGTIPIMYRSKCLKIK